MTAYINGQYVDGNELVAADLNQGKADAISAAEAGAATAANAALAAEAAALTTSIATKQPRTNVIDLGQVSGTVSLDLSQARGFKATLTGNAVISIINAPQAAFFTQVPLVLNTQGNSVTWGSSIVPWAPTLSSEGKDYITFDSLDGTEWYGNHIASGFDSAVLVEDDFLGAANAPVEGRVTPIGGKTYITNQPGTFELDGNGNVIAVQKNSGATIGFDTGVSDFTLEISVSSNSQDSSDCCLALVSFSADDLANNTWGLQIDSRFQRLILHTFTGGVYTDYFVTSYAGATSDSKIDVRIDRKGPVVTLFLDGVEQGSVYSPTNENSTLVGLEIAVGGNPSGTAKIYGPLRVLPYQGQALNWPNFTKLDATPLVALGAPGTWDDTDVNDPNVFFDTPNNRWALMYSGYSNRAGTGTSGGVPGADSQVQHCGMAYATSITGPYTKDPANPVMTAMPEDGIDAFNGGIVLLNGVYYQVYVSNNGTAIRLATSPDLHNWTRKGVIVSSATPTPVSSWRSQGVFDPFLRVQQNGTTLEMWICGSDGTNKRFGCFTSVDQGATWVENTAIAPILPPTNTFLNGSAGEPAVYVPPGKEGQQYMVSFDYVQQSEDGTNPPIARRIGEAISIDGGVTWHFRTNSSAPGNFGYESLQNFDSFYADGGDGFLYRFNSGANVYGPALDLNIQLECQKAPWGFSSLIYGAG